MSAQPHVPSLHERFERRLASGDVRVLYGVGVPAVVAVAFVVALLVAGSLWLVPALMMVILGMVAVVALGFAAVGDDDARGDHHS